MYMCNMVADPLNISMIRGGGGSDNIDTYIPLQIQYHDVYFLTMLTC